MKYVRSFPYLPPPNELLLPEELLEVLPKPPNDEDLDLLLLLENDFWELFGVVRDFARVIVFARLGETAFGVELACEDDLNTDFELLETRLF